MPKWNEITVTDKYKSLPPQAQAEVKTEWFKTNLLPEVEKRDSLREMGADKVYEWFMQQPDDTGEGIVRSTLGSAARGFGEIVPGTLEGVGALTGIEPISDLGESAREGLEYIAPVNPIYEQGIPAKVANVAGNVASIIGTSGVGGLAGKALGAERAAAAGSAAARQALTNQAIQAGAKSALYGTGFAQGAAAKAAENERLGITGTEGYLNLLGGGISELAPEMLPFGSALETSAARRLLGGVDDAAGRVIPGIRMSAAQEAAEGGSTQVLSNLSTQLTAPTGVETPDLFEGAGEAALWEGVGGAMFGAINKLGRTPPERQTDIQKAFVAKANVDAVDTVPDQTDDEKLVNMNAGGTTVVDPQGKTAVIAPPAPEPPSQIIPKELVVKANETSPDVSSSTTAFVELNENLLKTQAEGAADKAAQMLAQEQAAQAQAAAELQAPAGLPVPTVVPTVETPISDSPSPNLPPLNPKFRDISDKELDNYLEDNFPDPPRRPRSPTFVPTDESKRKDEEWNKYVAERNARFTEANQERSLRDLYAKRTSATAPVELPVPTAETLGVTAPPAPTLETPEGAARNAPKPKATQTASGKKLGDKIVDGENVAILSEYDQSTPGMPTELTVLEVDGIVDAKSNKVFATRRDMTPNEITVAQEKIRQRNALAKEMGMPQEEIPQPITPTQETPTTATEGTVMPGGSAMERDVTKPEQMTPEERFNRPILNASRPKSLPVGKSKRSTQQRLLTQFDKGFEWAKKNNTEKASISAAQKRNDLLKTRDRTGNFGTDQSADDYAFWKGASAFFEVSQSNKEKENERDLSETQKKAIHADDIQTALDFQSPVSAVAVDSYGITLPEGYVKQGDLYVFQPEPSPQTTTVATPTETAAPLAKEAAVASVVQQPAEGSIPAVEQESATTAIESNEKADIADAAMAFLEEDLTESKRQWSPEKIAAAKAYFASGGKDTDVLRAAFPKLVGSRPIVQAYLKADKEASEAQAKRDAADAKLAKEIERDEKEQAKAEEAQRKREELNIKTLNSLIQKTRTNVVQGTVKATDANQAVAILNRSGEIPNVLFTWIGTSKDFLADPANRVRYPETWAAVSANSKIEGMSENGQPIVFTDNVGVSDLDRKLANLQGTTPEVAAVRRVILHENIHKGMFFLSMKEKMQIFSFLRRMYSPQELDSLAESYSEYADWRTNQVSYFSILEEAMTRDFDSMVEIPRDGIWAEFMQFLRGIWQKITGKTSEPTLKDYKDVFRLIRNSLKNSEKANADMLVNGGGVRMSMSEFLSNVTPEQDAEYMAAVEAGDVAKQQSMVDAAAKAAGYRFKLFRGDGTDFTEFDPFKRSENFTSAIGFSFSDDRETAAVYGKVREFFVKGKTWTVDYLADLYGKTPESAEDWQKSYDEEVLAEFIGADQVDTNDDGTIDAFWEEKGASIIRIKNIADNNLTGGGNRLATLFIVRSPNQIKSADAVVKDDLGAVIPLSRRFQSASNDIRFSKVEYNSPNDAAFNSGAEVARNTDYDERDKEVRSTIRAAYDIAPKTNGPSVPLDELFSIVQQSMPDLTETEFSRILQGLYEDSGALLIEGESPFATFTTEGERAGSAIIMPPTDMTKDDVISMLRGMSAANPAPSGEINQELYDTVLTQLRNFISNGGRIPLPIQSYGATKAGRYNYTRQKDGLERDLRQGSGIGGTGQIDTGASFRDKVERENLEIQRIDSEVSRNRETTTEGRENRKREAGARPNVGMAGSGYSFADYAQIASRIGARVQEVSNDIGGGLAVMADGNGATTILINATQLGKRVAGTSFGLDEDGAIETIGNALVEELIHAADLAVQREAWIASGGRKPFTEFAIDSDKSMLDEMREVVASSNDPVKATQILFDAIQASRQLYESGAAPSDIDKFFASEPRAISSVMSEFVRQMIQQDMHQTVSEASLFRRFIERVMKMLQKIRDAIAPAKAGEFGDILKNRINETEMMLAMAYQQTGARASMIDPEDAATKQFAKNIKDINSGTAKAAFDGVQFVDFEPVDHIVKPNKSYEKIAIDYVDGLLGEGKSIEDIATSIMTPMFFDSIGISNDVKARQALTSEVLRRVTDLNGLSNTRLASKRLQKLEDLISAFWQGLGTESGGNQGQRAFIIGSPRYSWMFLKDSVKKEMKERRNNILTVQFGNNNATSFTQNSYENADKASTMSADEIAQDVVNNDEWALIKEGEQVFEGADKTLWERAKALVRRFAFYARAEAAEKVSASKASITDAERNELNAILTMPKAEREKAKAKDLAEFRSIMGKLLGEESPTDTPTEKKKRKKRKEIIDTVEKRVAEGQPIEPTAEEIANEIEIAENKASQIVYRFEELYRQGFKNPPEGMSKKEQKDSIIRAFRDQVKNPVSFEQFAERLDALKVGEEVSERLFLTASRERADLARMKKFKIEKRRVEIADKQASRLIYSTEERLRQGSKDLSKSTSGDSINKAFKDQVSDPVEKSKFAERLAKLDVSPDVAERLFKTAEREKTDLEAMAAFNILQGPKALQRMINEINNMRRGEEIPLRTPIPWRQLLSQSAKTVEEYRQRIFDAISANEELKNATPEQKARLADLFAEAWETKRKRILDSMQERLIREQEAKGNLSKKAAKALQENRMRIVEDINLGIFDNDEIAKIIAEKFGIKSEFTDEERQKIESLIAILQDEKLNRVKRNKAAYELLETLSAQTDISIAKLLSNFWVSSVLSGMNTVFSIGMSVFSGMGELTTALSRIFSAAFSNPKQLSSEVAAAFKTLARVLSAVPRQANRAWQYLVTGDQAFLDPSMNDALKNMDYASIGKNNQLSEQMAKSDKILEKSMGLFMRTVSRLLTALDLFNSGLTKEGSLSIVFRQLDLDPAKIQMLEKKSDLKAYKDQVIRDYFNNVQPKTLNEKALVDSYAMAEMMKALDEIGNVSENADQMAMQGAMTLDPSGLGGYGYRLVKSMMKSAESGTDKLLERNLRKWDEAVGVDEKAEAGVKLVLSYIFQFAAYNAANLVGVRFARFAGNKFNQSLSFLPLIGALRLYEAEFDSDRIRGKEAFTDMIKRNQITGVIAAVIGYYVLKAIAEEPDDEKRGAFINGGWSNLTPEKKQQKIASGQKEYTLGFGDTVINYGNWPGSGILAAIGGLSDLIRFSPDQWNDKTVANKLLSATTSGVFSAMEVPALSQFQELFGSSLSSKDPNEQKLTKFARVIGNYVGGFVPRILKDIDYLSDPNFRKYETLWEKTASHIPVYRRYEGKEYYDILGQQIQRNVYPGSREFMVKPTDPAYKVLGALNSRGIWLTPANAEHRMVGKGARRRSLTQEEADNYSLETGKGYKQMLLRYGQRALQMPTERARAFLLDKADEVRDRALKKVYRGYKPAT